MKKDEVRQIKEILLNWKQEILSSQEKAVKQISAEGTEVSFPDPTDRASYEEDTTLLLRIKDRESKLLPKIEEILRRIDRGNYHGTCEECGEEIPFERLLARPVTTMCIECKTDQEEKEKK
jgi:DnaK suppressor protein